MAPGLKEAGLILILTGLALLLLGGDAEFGGVVFIGPIPVPFGNNPALIGLAAVTGLALLLLLK